VSRACDRRVVRQVVIREAFFAFTRLLLCYFSRTADPRELTTD